MPFTLPPLPYGFDALEPFIDKTTMEIHHGKHHAAYIANVNKALESAPDLAGKSLEQLLANNAALAPEAIRTAVRNNGRRARESLDVLDHHGPERRRAAHRQAGRSD